MAWFALDYHDNDDDDDVDDVNYDDHDHNDDNDDNDDNDHNYGDDDGHDDDDDNDDDGTRMIWMMLIIMIIIMTPTLLLDLLTPLPLLPPHHPTSSFCSCSCEQQHPSSFDGRSDHFEWTIGQCSNAISTDHCLINPPATVMVVLIQL